MRQGGNKLHIVVNDAPILEFDRAKPIPGHQRRYLEDMDARMDQGIQVDEKFLPHPNPMTRCRFVANSLINALFAENYSLSMALCTWLADRIPELKMVKAINDANGETGIELIFDRDYERAKTEQGIKFHKPEKSTK